MSAQERQVFEAQAVATMKALWIALEREEYGNLPSISSWMDENGYKVVEWPPAEGGQVTVIYWTPSGDLESSTLSIS